MKLNIDKMRLWAVTLPVRLCIIITANIPLIKRKSGKKLFIPKLLYTVARLCSRKRPYRISTDFPLIPGVLFFSKPHCGLSDRILKRVRWHWLIFEFLGLARARMMSGEQLRKSQSHTNLQIDFKYGWI